MNAPFQPPQGPGYPVQQGPYAPPGQPAPGFGQGFPQGVPQGQPPQYAPGYAPGYPAQQLPQNAPRAQNNAPQVDLDSANAEDATEYPKCHPAGGQPWYFDLAGASERASFHETGSMIVWVTATVRQSPDPAYTPGMLVSIKIGGLGHPTKNNAAQGRLKALLSACTGEPAAGVYPPGHWAGRKAQLLGGALNGAPFMATFSLKGNRRDASGQLMQALVPSFQRG